MRAQLRSEIKDYAGIGEFATLGNPIWDRKSRNNGSVNPADADHIAVVEIDFELLDPMRLQPVEKVAGVAERQSLDHVGSRLGRGFTLQSGFLQSSLAF